MLIETYRRIRHSLVAFVPKFAPSLEAAGQFPPIVGTGFVVHESGLIATNQHVIEAMTQLNKPDGFAEIPAMAMFFILTEKGMVNVTFDIVGYAVIKTFGPQQVYYGPEKPDLAFVQLNVTGLLPVKLRPHGAMYEEGEAIATAGFPMGTDHLRVPGWIHQLSPTLQTGTLSAVHPFPCATPHGFTINVMAQGGASGSPIFNVQTGEVLGALYAGVFDLIQEEDGKQRRAPTNYTYGVASHYIINALPQLLTNEMCKRAAEDSKPIQQVFEEQQGLNMFTREKLRVPLPW
ncbi:trypsin-like peptidase domain-containing protein [Bradyrhizobium sp. 83012]|uniref:Trypsin-like peptidase domain-containing protein n=1 Tax=Bradyrhizobium aeschynomenes TaxID=2734909 RepID=A0ABX2C9Z0_9BRAD|nr:serine protease [Bradyrhizobium aeschynomenes]NPU64588.1 trypsin-like peptidase domain-containing protein [Bradyrhizobium aeschynomenes]